MAHDKIGVGIIGASPGRSWAAGAIIPGILALPDYKLVAVSSTRMETASEVASQFSVPNAYDNHEALVNHPDVNLVVVSVKVPRHLELVTAALEAGKHVYCEWPLGNGLAEAEQLATLARKKGVKAAVGLQARSNPTINYARDLVAKGYVGKLLSVSVVAAGMVGSTTVTAPNSYLADIRNGATMLTITIGHSFDAVLHILGKEVRALNATTAVQTTQVKIIETGEMIPQTSEDQVAVSGLLDDEAVFSFHYYGGPPRDATLGFYCLIHGTAGDLKITAPGGIIQILDVTLEGSSGDSTAMETLVVPQQYAAIPGAEGRAQNLAQAFQRLAADIRNGTSTCPTFDDAVTRHKMIDAIQKSGKSGARQLL